MNKGYFTYLEIENYYDYSSNITIFKNSGKFYSSSGLYYPDDGILNPFILLSNLISEKRSTEVARFLDFANLNIGIKFDPDKFDWQKYSWAIARFYKSVFDSSKFNWEEDSWAVAEYCPQNLDPNKFNWQEQSWAVAIFCPDKLDYEKYNWNSVIDRQHAIEAGFIPPNTDYWEQRLIERYHD